LSLNRETERSKVTIEANMRRQNLMQQMEWSPYVDPRNLSQQSNSADARTGTSRLTPQGKKARVIETMKKTGT
jgi:hypothetical protein